MTNVAFTENGNQFAFCGESCMATEILSCDYDLTRVLRQAFFFFFICTMESVSSLPERNPWPDLSDNPSSED